MLENEMREPVVKDCYDKLVKTLSKIDTIQNLLDECYHIINKNFNEYKPKAYPRPCPQPNLRYGMVKLATFINSELLVIEEQVQKIIHSLVSDLPKLADSD